jgi:CheY-like chemotaxis protein
MERTLKILVVDDSPVLRALIIRELERSGYATLEAENGDQALNVVMNTPGISLVTMDVEMPGMDGFETCQALHKLELSHEWMAKKRKCPPVLFVTGRDSMELRRKGFESGAVDFIGKKYLESELLSSVDRLLKPEGRFKGLRALVVEDSRSYRFIVVQCLKQLGLLVSEAENGEGACKFLQAAPNAYDLILSDYEMPGMNGLALVRKIRTELGLHGVPVVMLSGVADKETQIEMFNAGISDCLEKPFIREEFIARISAHLDSSTLQKRLKASVNEFKRLNQELERSKGSLEKANSDARELLHVLCHDLSNPFGAIVSMLELVDSYEMYKSFKPDILAVAENGMEVIGLVRKMRALEEGKINIHLQTCSLAKILNDSAMMVRAKYAAKNVSLLVEADASAMALLEPASFLNSVLNNLLTNALKFSFSGSKVYARAFKDGGMPVVTVTDTGIGMPKKILDVIFEVGRPTSREGTAGESGTGFGMPLVKRFVEAYGGKIAINSKEGRQDSDFSHGTEVRIELVAPSTAAVKDA